ncbi:NUDIX hydrolase [Salinibacterium sp. PAMC 21357]|uniref:NUDIX hydrolase n=1 Tax=Salinibacterium sp. PAMC 21357 TaxID=1112215 RepID=UPI000288AADC|nr:NUDIX domain-containing protein [Salinibacterium sp. PAMC 21357]
MAVNRSSSRVLLFDRDQRFLLFLTKAPDTSGIARWLTPGGGVDPGESHHEAAVRELEEETGLVLSLLDEPVWSHDFEVEWDAANHDTGHAVYYAATTDAFTPSDAQWTDDERVDVLEHRWWTIDQLAATTDRFEPAELVSVIREQLGEMNQ